MLLLGWRFFKTVNQRLIFYFRDDGGFHPHFDMPPYGGGPPLHGPPPPSGWGHGAGGDLPPPPQAPYVNPPGPRG